MLDFLKAPVETFQDFILLSGRAVRNIFRSPHYADDIFLQMDIIGVGSLPIVILIGFVQRRHHGHADGARADATTARRGKWARSFPSRWCASWGRC